MVAKIDAVYHEVGRMSVDAVVFLKTVNRMCSQFENCDQCPIYGLVCACASKDGKENTVVERVEKWAKEHPVKTRLSDFLEKISQCTIRYRWASRDVCDKGGV